MEQVTVRLANRRGAYFRVSRGKPLLGGLEAQGIALAYGCRYGGCISCAAKLLSGRIQQRNAVALNGRQLADGYVLLCVACPLTDCTFDVGVESHDRLYRNPFAMTPTTYMDHDHDYPPDYLAAILKQVKTIAMVGASSDPTKFSYGVLRVLHETGYDMIPVNPNEAGTEIRGLRVYESLAAIERPVDMVQVFRNSDALPESAREPMGMGARVLGARPGVLTGVPPRPAEAAGLKVV